MTKSGEEKLRAKIEKTKAPTKAAAPKKTPAAKKPAAKKAKADEQPAE